MTTGPNIFFVFASLLNVWKITKGVEILTCLSSSSIQIGSATTTFQFGDGNTPYDTVLSCTWTFTASDSSASLVIGQTLQCGDGDYLEITNAGCTSGNNNFSIPISSPYVITSPNFPGYYPNNMECNYTFSPVPPSLGLVISFQFIHLDYEDKCYDEITRREGDKNGNQIARICQGYPVSSPVISPNETYRTKGALFLHFVSESSFPARGFRAIVQQDPITISGNTESTTTLVTESTTKKNTTPTTKAESTTISTADNPTTTSQSSTSTLAKVITVNNSPLTTITESNTRSTLPPSTVVTTRTSSSTTSKDATQSATAKSTTVSTPSKLPAFKSSTSYLTTITESNTRSTLPPSTVITTRTSSSTTSKENDIEDNNGPYVYIGSIIAAIAVIILVVAFVWKFCLKQRNASGNNYQTSFVDREHIYSVIGNPGHSTGSNRSERQEPVEYATIDDQSITGYEEPKSYKYTYSNAVFSS